MKPEPDSISTVNYEKQYEYLLKSFYPSNYSIVSEANDRMALLLEKEFDFVVMKFQCGSELNGWTIPCSWVLQEFTLSNQEGRLILSDKHSSLRVSSHCDSVDVELDYEELKKHLVVGSGGNSKEIIWDWRNLYRHEEDRDWSISVTEKEFRDLDKESRYRIRIFGKSHCGTMKVLYKDSNPLLEKTVTIQAHNCHPYQFSDGLSGVIASIIIQQMDEFKLLPFNVRTLICPELYGTMFYLNSIEESLQSLSGANQTYKQMLGAVILASIGNHTSLKLQESYKGHSHFSQSFKKTCIESGYEVKKFRDLHGNDETILEAPPFRIPTVSLSRVPYDTYHSSGDIPLVESFDRIMETIFLVLKSLKFFSESYRFGWNLKGIPKLDTKSNSDLFKKIRRNGVDESGSDESSIQWNKLMNSLPMLIDDGFSTRDIALLFSLKESEVFEYIQRFIEKGFIVSTDETSK